jgi:hypothetical protein
VNRYFDIGIEEQEVSDFDVYKFEISNCQLTIIKCQKFDVVSPIVIVRELF